MNEHWREFTKEARDEQRAETSVPTVKEFESTFITDYAEANRQKPSSIEAKKSILKNHLVPMFGDPPLDEITTE